MADVTSTFSAKDIGFTSTVNRMQKSLDGFSSNLGGFAMKLAGLAVAFVGVQQSVAAFNRALEMGGRLDDLSKTTGASAGELLLLEKAFSLAGSSADAVGPAIARLSRFMVEASTGGKAQIETMNKLGLSYAQLKNLTPTEQMRLLAESIMALPTPAERTAAAMDIFGRSGATLIPLFSDFSSELDRARGFLGSLPGVMDVNAAALDHLDDNIKEILGKFDQFVAGLITGLIPALTSVTDQLANIDAAGFGAQLSQYLERTLAWTSSTFRLGEALEQIQVAIAGITSGNFGGGLSLLFLTARDTALNAINNIVAAAMAALQTVGGALVTLFSPGSTTMAFIGGAFTMLGAKIAASLSDTIAGILEKIPFLGSVARAVREAQAEAEQAVQDISNIMHYEADSLKSEFADVGKAMPENFAQAYKANLENPLFEMKDRTAETAAQMEKVAAATRSAAFDAEKFGNALADARLDRLTPGGPSSPRPDDASAPGIFGMDPADIPAASAGAASRGKGGAARSPAPAKPTTAMDRLRSSAQDDPAARAQMFRIQDEQAKTNERAATMRGDRMFGAAARAEIRGERRAERRAQDFDAKQMATDRFGGSNMGEAFSNARRMGADPGSQADFEKFFKEQAKNEKERAREEEEKSGGGGKGSAPSDPMASISGKIDQIIREITERLPQNAMS